MAITFCLNPPYFNLKLSVSQMTQNGLKHILNMFLKSVTKASLTWNVKNLLEKGSRKGEATGRVLRV